MGNGPFIGSFRCKSGQVAMKGGHTRYQDGGSVVPSQSIRQRGPSQQVYAVQWVRLRAEQLRLLLRSSPDK